MAYEPTEWKSGDVITAEKLNKIETELASRFLIITVENGHLSRTWQEIYDALRVQRIPMIFVNPDGPVALSQIELIVRAEPGVLYTNLDPTKPSWKATTSEDYPIPYSTGSSGGLQ